jgi:hypothetical protein
MQDLPNETVSNAFFFVTHNEKETTTN